MAERKISEKSLENLKRFNQENKAITRESIEISLLQLLEKKDLKKITISELVERADMRYKPKKWKIIADSGCDYRSLDNLAPDTEFVSVPLTIQVGETIYRDDAQLNIDQMMEEMYATTTASKSACPSPDDYMKSFEGADNIVVVTITGTLSGSYNSAEIAKKIYLEEHPDAKIHVIDSLSATK